MNTRPQADRPLRAGDLVHARGERWRVAHVSDFSDCQLVELAGLAHTNRGRRVNLVGPFDTIERLPYRESLRTVTPRQWLRALARVADGATPHLALRAVSAARIEILPYQLEPAIALLRGDSSRVLIADAVGLGKTIQAGLILAELIARGQADHVLICVPAGLREQWVRELGARFSIEPFLADAASLRARLGASPGEINPWRTSPCIVTSMDYIKQPEVLREAAACVWDLVIVDEAHLAGGASDRAVAVALVTSSARRVVLLSATPHSGDERAFQELCALGRVPGEDAILLFRRSRREVGLPEARRTRLLSIDLTVEERHMHALLDAYARLVWRVEEDDRHHARLAMVVLKKRALSGAFPLARSVERRLALVGQPRAAAFQAGLPLDLDTSDDGPDSDAALDAEPSTALAAPGLADRDEERARLVEILEAARTAANRDSKVGALVRLLRRIHEPVIVFTEYRDTLGFLAEKLAWAGPLASLHGGQTAHERRAEVRRFNDGHARVLLATDAASQGLNLQARCRVVVNVELPWNPVRLEQRAGRVDRIGQRRRPHAIHLLARSTGETRVLARLVRRIERAHQSLGQLTDSIGPIGPLGRIEEAEMARLMIDPDGIGHLPDAFLPSVHTAEAAPPASTVSHRLGDRRLDAQAEASRVSARRLETFGQNPRGTSQASRQEWVEGDRVWLAMLPASGRRRRSRPGWLRGPAVVCILCDAICDGTGRHLEDLVIPIHLPLPRLKAQQADADIRQLVRRWLDTAHQPLRERASEVSSLKVAEIVRVLDEVLRVDRHRVEAMAICTEGRSEREVQPALFDGRALAEAKRRQGALAARHERCAGLLAQVHGASTASASDEPHPVLVLAIAGE